ncbi:peptide ABC transporter substrate-binding protein [Clostridium sp. CM028]|nr:peptide ABC transporter substrate-binding protein [Clostridium sp. CF011]MBW9146932.1 peptide ABC transporter substrate-binding protein [Clostridium sp. CM027]MBW9148028.1 peptide ABC transporter substrate-binding protein [Clostridium sp. CM028]UVE42779.1 peptide ABC transporter substrate-binding protein [Clostridium sp. CM027]WLC63441.1 peptide ABC transporter substrate-binding protein [Clostridium sp. CM028]
MKMNKSTKISATLLAVTLGVSLLSGCGTKAAPEANGKVPQVITFNLGAEPKTIDPALSQASDSADVIGNAFEGLMRLDDKDKPIPGMADRYEMSKDGLTYTFHIRSGAQWSDGKPVVAGDFEYAWKRVLKPATASVYSYQLFYLKNAQGYNESELAADKKTAGVKSATVDEVGVKAKDDSTLVVTLENPTAYFLSLMAFETYMPIRKDVADKDASWATKPATYITNGAFKMKEWKPKDVLTFVKNDKYWDVKNIKLDTLNYKMLEDQTAALSAYKAGQMDLIKDPPQSEIPALVADGSCKITPNYATYYYVLNLTAEAVKINPEAAKAIQNPKVRKALSLALNRKDIVDNVSKGGQTPATSFVPKGSLEPNGKDFANKAYYPAEGDIAQAKKLLAEAGYPDGKGFPKITLLYNTLAGHQNIAAAVQDMWKTNLGVNIELKNQEWKVFIQTRNTKQYILARNGWNADYTDPMTFLDLFTTSSGNNDAGYSNPAYDAKIIAAKKELDPAKRMAILHEAEDIIMNNDVVIPIYGYTNTMVSKPNIMGVRTSALGKHWFQKAYVTAAK